MWSGGDRSVALTPLAAIIDPITWLAREVAVAGYAAGRGGPVVPPAPDRGPHLVDGLAISLWEFVDVRPGRAAGRELGAALGALHRATDGFTGPLPYLTAATDQIADALDACERDRVVPAPVLWALRDRHRTVLSDLDEAGSASGSVVLHGDAHAGNLLRGAGGWVWVDLEETGVGPPEWDVAVLTGPDGDAAALAGYTAATGRAVRADLGPFHRARELEAVVWRLVMAAHYPDRYGASADEGLAALLSGSCSDRARRRRRGRRPPG